MTDMEQNCWLFVMFGIVMFVFAVITEALFFRLMYANAGLLGFIGAAFVWHAVLKSREQRNAD